MQMESLPFKKLRNEGVKGLLPLGRLPLWGREGVTLISLYVISHQNYKGMVVDKTRKKSVTLLLPPLSNLEET